jgi:hypothetical protein
MPFGSMSASRSAIATSKICSRSVDWMSPTKRCGDGLEVRPFVRPRTSRLGARLRHRPVAVRTLRAVASGLFTFLFILAVWRGSLAVLQVPPFIGKEPLDVWAYLTDPNSGAANLAALIDCCSGHGRLCRLPVPPTHSHWAGARFAIRTANRRDARNRHDLWPQSYGHRSNRGDRRVLSDARKCKSGAATNTAAIDRSCMGVLSLARDFV